jgi:dimethylaniline monooxygenase (N-oxide forming)
LYHPCHYESLDKFNNPRSHPGNNGLAFEYLRLHFEHGNNVVRKRRSFRKNVIAYNGIQLFRRSLFFFAKLRRGFLFFGEITLETPDFFNKVKKGEILTRQGEIVCFDGKQVLLSNGETIETDLVVFATGFRQTIPFLPEDMLQRLIDKDDNFLLYRHILPIGIPGLAFIGYNTSIQCPISSEFGALWLCEYLKGRVYMPSEEETLKEATGFIRWRSQFRMKGAACGLSTMPGTIHHVDVLLKDMNASLPFLSLIADWLVVINPARYNQLRKKIVHRNKVQQHKPEFQ